MMPVSEGYEETGHAVGGFSLVELLMVVAIIGTLAAIAIPQFSDIAKVDTI